MFPKLLARQTIRGGGGGRGDEAKDDRNSFYDVLYAFHVRRGKFRSAAEVCFEQAIRLAEESTCLVSTGTMAGGGAADRGLAILQRQAVCLSTTVNALQLVGPEDQWLIKPGFAGNYEDDHFEQVSLLCYDACVHYDKLSLKGN